jgi:hypothetical protein
MTETRDRSFSFKGEQIPDRRLRRIWDKKFSDKPYPNVKAYKLRRRHYIRLNDILTHELNIPSGDMKEYGYIPKGVSDALVLNTNEDEYIVYAREDSLEPLDASLEHELRHIYSDDDKYV